MAIKAQPDVSQTPLEAAADPAEELIEATVVPGRTVMVGVTTRQVYDPDLKIQVPNSKPGKAHSAHRGAAPVIVTLPRYEVERLIRLGFLVDPNAAPVAIDDGSSVKIAQATSVTS